MYLFYHSLDKNKKGKCSNYNGEEGFYNKKKENLLGLSDR